jgi:hypothetical protein
MRGLRRRVAVLERKLGRDRPRQIATWREYGRAMAEGWLEEATLTPAMNEAVRSLLEQKLREYLRSRGAGRQRPEQKQSQVASAS